MESLNMPFISNLAELFNLQKREEPLILIETVIGNQGCTQLQRTYHSFKERPKTRMQVSWETGINRANICWYVADLLKAKKIAVIKIDRCPVTKYKAQFLSTDIHLIKKKRQKQSTFFSQENSF